MKKIIPLTNSKISVKLDPLFLPHSAGEREKTIKKLLELQKREIRKIFCIDGTKASSNIVIIDDDYYNKGSSSLLLPNGIDGVILNTSKKAQLILPVADCAPIVAYHKSGEICGSFHAGYKGVAGELAGDLGIITTMVENLKEVTNSNNLEDFEFYIGPMIGRKFELPRNYIEPMFSKIFQEYNLNSAKYFLKHDKDDSKTYLHLRLLIRDMLKIFGKKIKLQGSMNGSFFDNGITNKWSSEYPSHRLYTQFGMHDEEIKKLYKKLNSFNLYLNNYNGEKGVLDVKNELKERAIRIKSEKFLQYKKDYRLAIILEN